MFFFNSSSSSSSSFHTALRPFNPYVLVDVATHRWLTIVMKAAALVAVMAAAAAAEVEVPVAAEAPICFPVAPVVWPLAEACVCLKATATLCLVTGWPRHAAGVIIISISITIIIVIMWRSRACKFYPSCTSLSQLA